MRGFDKSLITRHSENFKLGHQRIVENRRQWDDLAERCIKIFDTVKKEAENQKFFLSLYIIDSRKIEEYKKKLPFIQFGFVGRCLDYEQITSKEPVIERDCSLLILLCPSIVGFRMSSFFR